MPAAVQSYGDVAVSPHILSSQAAMEMLAAGGNALDAAVAANAVQGVVAPETCGIGGDLFALIHEPGEPTPLTLNSSGPAGTNASAARLRDEGHERMPPLHPATVTVPGCVRGWEELVSRLGRLPLRTLLEPAVRHAEEGFPASAELSRAFAARHEALSPQPSAAELYPGGVPPEPGQRIVRPRLAATLGLIAAQGASGFYRGFVAGEITKATDGLITTDDLAGFEAEWVEPVRMEVFDVTGWTTPPNTQGYLTLATLRLFELLGPPEDPHDPEWSHLLIEAYRALAWERDDLVADPRFTEVDLASRLTDEALMKRAGEVRRDRAGNWPPPATPPGGTAYLCVVDGDGMAVSLIQSNYWGIGSNLAAGHAGFIFHNRGGGFDLRPGHPNELAPGKRPLHTLSPSLWTSNGRLAAVLGTRGGNQQPQLLAQVGARLFGAGTPPAEALAAARWTLDRFGPGSEPALLLEPSTAPATIEGLQARGHSISVTEGPMPGWGPVSVISVSDAGLRTGAADPRVDTAAALAR